MLYNNYILLLSTVLPNPPEKVTAEEKTPLGIQVTWQTPFPLKEFPPGLIYRIDYRISDVQAPPFSVSSYLTMFIFTCLSLLFPFLFYSLHPFSLFTLFTFFVSGAGVRQEEPNKPTNTHARKLILSTFRLLVIS